MRIKKITLPLMVAVFLALFAAGFYYLKLPAQAAAIERVQGVRMPEAIDLSQVAPGAGRSSGGTLKDYLGSVQAPQACTADTPDMISYWPLDDAISSTQVMTDQVGGNNGSCTGGFCPEQEAGRVNFAFEFSNDDRLDVPDSPALDWNNPDSFSIEVWANFTESCEAGRRVFVGKYRGTSLGLESWWVGCEVNNKAAFNLRDAHGNTLTINGGPVINDGNWHHIVAQRDSAQNRNLLYVDGELATSQVQTYTGDFTSDQELNVGYYNVDPFYYYTGLLDEIALYSRALTLDEVQSHFNGGAGQSYCTDAPVAGNDAFVAVLDNPLSIPGSALLANDSDPDGDAISIQSVDAASAEGGTITGSDPYIYTRPSGFLGEDTFTYTIEDTDGNVATATVTVTVRASNDAPEVTNPGDQANTEGDDVSLQIVATDPDSDAIVYSAQNLPPGLSIDPESGLISGAIGFTAAAGSPYSVEVTATDAGFATDTETFTWTVTDANGPPVFLNQPSNQFNSEGDHISFAVEAEDPDGDALTYSASGLPDGLTIDENTGLIRGIMGFDAADGSPYSVQIEVSDGIAPPISAEFTWFVDEFEPLVHLPLMMRDSGSEQE